MSKDNKKNIFSTLGRWAKRGFFGASKEVDNMAVEQIVSPSMQVFKEFVSRWLPMTCVFLLICMFALAFIGPILVPLD